MLKSTLATLLLFTYYFGNAQNTKSAFDKALADSLGADEYGMKKYVLVILKTGSNKTTDKHFVDSMFQGHMKNIGNLAALGKLVVAGPMLSKNEKEYRGIFVLNASSIDDAKEILKTDPAISSKLLDTELYSWYCSAALPMFLPYHDKVKSKSF
ncbi:MAG: YciI family protein [Chitinophagaceae bacterium]